MPKDKKKKVSDSKRKSNLSLLVRKLSVFYLFILVFILAALFFFYKYVPQNKDELNERGLRVLNSLSRNFLKKNDDLTENLKTLIQIDTSGTHRNIERGTSIYLLKNTKLKIEEKSSLLHRRVHVGDSKIQKSVNGWEIIYPIDPDDQLGSLQASISMDNFALQVLNARDDMFSSYMILLDSSTTTMNATVIEKQHIPSEKNARYLVVDSSINLLTPNAENSSSHNSNAKHAYYVIYQLNDLTSSKKLKIDSLSSLQEGTDLSGILDINISGKKYKMFLRHFEFNNSKLVLAGLLPKETYDQNVSKVPSSYIATCLISILLIFTALPFIKVFFLSSHEIITARDVTGCSLSLFGGTSVLLLILVYLFLNLIVSLTYENRLSDVGSRIRTDFERELDSARKQLRVYDHLKYEFRDNIIGQALEYRINKSPVQPNNSLKANPVIDSEVDSLFAPTIYRNFNRVFWVDSSGMTRAKWNPFDFKTPLTNISKSAYFPLWRDGMPNAKPLWKTDYQAVYAGKSDATGEFQLFIVQPSIDTGLSAIVLAASPLCSIYPVLQPGFGFCLVDPIGNVLVHSDRRRNLSENILEETADNPLIRNCIEYKNSAIIDNVELYGKNFVFRVFPIRGQSLSLLVFYQKNILATNIFRIITFSIQAILIIFISVFLIVVMYNLTETKPPTLRFDIHRTEWIRPLFKYNFYEYALTAYIWLLVTALLFFVSLVWLAEDLSPLLYISLLLPVYSIGMLSVQRNDEKTNNTRPIIPVFLVVLNIIIWRLIHSFSSPLHERQNLFLVFLFELAAAFIICKQSNKFYKNRRYEKVGSKSEETSDCDKNVSHYRNSVYLLILLIAFIPTMGIVIYAFQSEKYQFKKRAELAVANSFEARDNYLVNSLPSYKKLIQKSLEKDHYFNDLKYNQSFYLSGRDSLKVYRDSVLQNDSARGIIDRPYVSLMDQDLAYFNPGLLENFSIKDSASDQTWRFAKDRKGNIRLHYTLNNNIQDSSCKAVYVTSSIFSPLNDFWHLHWPIQLLIILTLGLLIYFAKQTIRAALERLFFFDYMKLANKCTNVTFLNKFFTRSPVVHFARPAVTKPLILEKKELALLDEPMKYFKEVEWINSDDQETKIMAATAYFANAYEKIWSDLKSEQRFVLFDFAEDKYTNYKKAQTILELISKGILILDEKRIALDFFSLSFRNYLLSKKGTDEINKLRQEYALPGVWESMRIPILSIVAAASIFLVLTQGEFTEKISGILASAAALIPLVFKLFEKKS